MGWQPVSFDFDKQALAAAGMKVEPDKVVKLPGLPDPEGVEFAVTFNSKGAKGGKEGLMEYAAKLDMKGSPPVRILFRGNVTVPDVRLVGGVDALDFGDVQVGHCREMYVVLANPKEVNAEWKATRPLEQAKDWGFFACDPPEGTLAPGEERKVKVTFTPTAERAFAVKVQFKVQHNPKPVVLALKGYAHELKVEVAPSALDLSAVLPHAGDGERPDVDATSTAGHELPYVATAPFELINPTDYPIMVYSVELDEQYVTEEAILREADGYAGDAMLMPPRNPEDPMWPELIEAHEGEGRRGRGGGEAAEAAAAAEAGGEEGAAAADGAAADGAAADGEKPKTPNAADGAAEVGEIEQEGPPEPTGPRRMLVLAGAPLAGLSEQAQKLAADYELPVVGIEEQIKAVARAAAAAARAAAGRAPPPRRRPPRPPPRAAARRARRRRRAMLEGAAAAAEGDYELPVVGIEEQAAVAARAGGDGARGGDFRRRTGASRRRCAHLVRQCRARPRRRAARRDRRAPRAAFAPRRAAGDRRRRRRRAQGRRPLRGRVRSR